MKKEFDILSRSFESSGSFLIEASAGTGKTFSIEHLFIRALLDGMHPQEILMMTFTRKAARQLVVRIRKTLSSFYGQLLSEKDLETLPDYFQPYLESGSLIALQRFLRMGLESIDCLPIFTIHGFCQFLLQQDHVFQMPSIVDRTTWVTQIGPVYLARYLHFRLGREGFPLRLEEWDYLIEKKWFFSSSLLCQDLLSQENVYPLLHRDISWEQILVDIRTRFLECTTSPFAIWDSYVAANFPFKGFASTPSLKKSLLFSCFQALSSRKIHLQALHDIETGLSLIGSDCLLKRAQVKLDVVWADLLKKEFRRELLCFHHGNLFVSQLVADLFHSDWWQSIQESEGARPDSLLKMLLERLMEKKTFLKECREKFSYVIIDEFQDTDPLQWKIFEKLFFNDSPARLVLVGDPKQSIYSFRRSDVYTYFKASASLDQSYTLETNFRSQSSLVESLNLLFSASQDWMFLPKTNQLIHPIAVASHHFDREPEQRLHFLSWDGSWNHLFRETALRIRDLIQKGFCPSQIAVLVSRHSMAKDLLKEMKGIPVHVPHVFPEEIKQVACWMWALLTSLWDQTVRCLPRLLLTPFFGFDWSAVHQTSTWIDVKCILHNLFQVYSDSGFPVLFTSLLQMRWGNKTLGDHFQEKTSLRERLIWRQLLFSLFEKKHSSPAVILDWLLRLMQGQHVFNEPLPQDYLSPAVQLLTIHASKGLEFDCVFALGLADRSFDRTGLNSRWIQLEEDGVLFSVMGSFLQPQEVEAYLDESDAEKLRLLYVALTRAKEHLFIPLPVSKKIKTKPRRGSAAPIELFAATFSASGRDYKALYCVIEEGLFEKFNIFLRDKSLLAVKLEPKKIQEVQEKAVFIKKENLIVWKPTVFSQSFSSSYRKVVIKKRIPAPSSYSWSNWMEIPRGPQVGIFLHDLLSRLITCRHLSLFNLKEIMRAKTPYPMTDQDQEDLFHLLKSVLVQPLPHLGICLEDIPEQNCVTEIPFCLSGMKKKNDLWKGVIDLLFYHEQSVFLLDWKSNWLGSDFSYYMKNHLMDCCREYGYFIQLELYASVLKKRLKSSSFSFGGSILFFLRAEQGLFFHAE